MAAGAAPVVNDAPNNRMVADSPFIQYVAPTPGDLARALVRVVEDPSAVDKSREMSLSLSQTTWESSGAQFVVEFERTMRG